jgi:hypothetical protein
VKFEARDGEFALDNFELLTAAVTLGGEGDSSKFGVASTNDSNHNLDKLLKLRHLLILKGTEVKKSPLAQNRYKKRQRGFLNRSGLPL